MKTKKSGILILFLCIFCVVGCDNDEKKGREVTDYKEYILTVASRKVPGVLTSDGHNYLTDVYAVKKELSDEWIPFGNIEGFDFEEKYECKIKISETSYLDYGMGEPAWTEYERLEVISKEKKDSEEMPLHFIPKWYYLLAELNYKRFMFKKLCILLIFSKLNEIKHLIDKYRMHNLYAIFAKLLNICKQIAGNLVNESGNVPRRGVVPKFSDLEVVALNMASEAVGIDSESLLFANLQEYRVEIPNLISRRQYNDRRKITSSLCNAIRERMVAKMDGGEDYFCIDSKPIEVCRIARSKRCSMGKKDFSKAPGVGYCASQSMYYYGYKLHAVCGLSGVIHSFDLTKASVHDIHYLKDVKVDYSNCTVIGDRGYISAQVQLDLFETANIRLEVPYRCNQKEWKPTFPAFAKARKRIETLFSQLCDQFMIIRNYAKDTDGLFARIIGKISALTILQYINYKNEKPIGRVKYALF